MKLLAIFSDPSLSNRLKAYFLLEGILFESARGYVEASEKLELYEYDCVLVETDGSDDKTKMLENLVKICKEGGVLVVSSIASLEEKLKVFDLGADDFLNIPFHEKELLARIKAIIRRKRFDTKSMLYFGNLVIDLLKKSVTVWDKPLNLTKKEYEILLYFIANKGKTLSKTTLSEYLWGDEADNMDSFNLLVVHIKNLRNKLQQSKAELEIKNVYGVGYQIIEL